MAGAVARREDAAVKGPLVVLSPPAADAMVPPRGSKDWGPSKTTLEDLEGLVAQGLLPQAGRFVLVVVMRRSSSMAWRHHFLAANFTCRQLQVLPDIYATNSSQHDEHIGSDAQPAGFLLLTL